MLYLHIGKENRTEFRTEKKLVRMNTRFYLHNHVRKDGTCIVYLRITSDSKEVRHPLDLYVKKDLWDKNSQKVIGENEQSERLNLILENIRARLTEIKTDFYLRKKHLTAQKLLDEFRFNIPKVDFLAFAEQQLEIQKDSLRKSSYKRNLAVLRKVRRFDSNILFSDIDESFFTKYINWCKSEKNNQNTISSNIGIIKKYLRLASKSGITINIMLDDIKVQRVNGNRTSLSKSEVRELTDFYESKWITPRQKHALGLFLFTCWTGIRLGDLMSLNHENFHDDNVMVFTAKKTGKFQRIPLNNRAQILKKDIDWNHKISEHQLRLALNDSVTQAKIKKKVTFHIGRHTFATNYYRATKDVIALQQLLGHSNVRETMIYTHIVDLEDDEGIHKMDLNF